MKRFFYLTAILALALCCLGCTPGVHQSPAGDGIQVVATLFPQYDFAKAVAGQHATVTLLLPAGVESHSYEPTPADIVSIENADLFVYTGDQMEHWAAELLSGTASKGLTALDLSAGIALSGTGHAHEEQENSWTVEQYDPHIWTDPANAMIMVEEIRDALIKLDPEHMADYESNAADYLEELTALDQDIRSAVASARTTTLYFGGRFAFHYFAEEYGLTCVSAYDSCSEETEPSARAVADIVAGMQATGAKVIYYEELVDPKVARTIAQEAGAQMLLLHSCHNLSKAEREAGETYLSLMRQNLENLKEGFK